MAIDPVSTLGSILGTGSVSGPGMSSTSSVKSVGEIAGAGAAKGVVGGHAKDFSEVLSQVIAGTAQTIKEGEAASIAGIKGQASVQQVVEAVMMADQSLQVAVAIRDKVVSAYLEISRMSI